MSKKILTGIYIVLLIFLIYVFQIFIVDGRTLFGVKPNLILISVIVISLWYGLYAGTCYGFITGILTDLLFGSQFGMFTICYTIVGAAIGWLNVSYRKENKMSLVYVTIISTAIFEIVQYIEYLFVTHIYSNIFYLLKQIILSSLLNIIIVYIVYNLISRIIAYFESKLRRENNAF